MVLVSNKYTIYVLYVFAIKATAIPPPSHCQTRSHTDADRLRVRRHQTMELDTVRIAICNRKSSAQTTTTMAHFAMATPPPK